MGLLEEIRSPQWANPFATHRPVLWAVASRTRRPLLEFGCGEGSTPLLDRAASLCNVPLITLDTDQAWLERYSRSLASPLHEFRLVSSWEEELASEEWDGGRYGVVFVDQSPWEARATTVRRFSHSADYVVLHDCDYLPSHGLLGESIAPIVGPHDPGKRSYAEVFKHFKEFFPPEPWPLRETGPPTLLASNFHECDLDVDLEAFSPPRWSRAPILRGHRVGARVGAVIRRR